MTRKIGYLLKRVNDKLRARADADFATHGLTFTQSRVLRFLRERGGETTQKEIEDTLNVAHPTVVGVVARLKEKGFVSCRVADNDKRNRIVCMTDKAVETLHSMGTVIERNEAMMMKGLTEEQINTLEKGLLTILGNLCDDEALKHE